MPKKLIPIHLRKKYNIKKSGAKNISPLHRKVLMKSFNTILYNHYRMEKDSAASKIQSHLREQYINYMNDINLFNLKTKK